MKLKITTTRKRTITERAEFEIEVPELLSDGVRSDEVMSKARGSHSGWSHENLGARIAQEAVKKQSASLEWEPHGDVDVSDGSVSHYEIVEELPAA